MTVTGGVFFTDETGFTRTHIGFPNSISGNVASYTLINGGTAQPAGTAKSTSLGVTVKSAIDGQPAHDFSGLLALPKVQRVLWGGPGTVALVYWDRPVSQNSPAGVFSVNDAAGVGYVGTSLQAGNGTALWQINVASVGGSFTPWGYNVVAGLAKESSGGLSLSATGVVA